MKTKQLVDDKHDHNGMKPLHDFILVKPIEPPERSIGGIVIPDVAKDKPQRGIVLAIGPGRVLENGQTVPVSVTVGDRVLFTKYAGHHVDGDDLMLIRDSDVPAGPARTLGAFGWRDKMAFGTSARFRQVTAVTRKRRRTDASRYRRNSGD